MNNDRISRYRAARLALYPPNIPRGHARYALIAHTIRGGIPSASILLDGVLPGLDPRPTLEYLLEAFDSVIGQHMLARP